MHAPPRFVTLSLPSPHSLAPSHPHAAVWRVLRVAPDADPGSECDELPFFFCFLATLPPRAAAAAEPAPMEAEPVAAPAPAPVPRAAAAAKPSKKRETSEGGAAPKKKKRSSQKKK